MNTKRSGRPRRGHLVSALLIACGFLCLVGAEPAWSQVPVSEEAESPDAPANPAADLPGDPDSQSPVAEPDLQDEYIEEFVVQGSIFDDARAAVAERAYADELVNVMTAEDFAKYSAVDVADALKRIAGLNVVEGQFAIIRGLEDRYSSTLYNGAAIPSPDPDSQSIQLDLFPSEVVSNVIVSKTFGPELPSNSAGGSIDIETLGYPDEFEMGVKAKGGFNTNAIDNFLEWEHHSPVGNTIDGWDTAAQEYGGYAGGRTTLFDREVRAKVVGNWGVDYDTGKGFQEGREPRTRFAAPPDGDLQLGELSLTDGRFDLTQSDREEQTSGYGAFGFDLDEESQHSVDFTFFWTQKDEEVVQLRTDGYFPRFDYQGPGGPVELEQSGSSVDSSVFDGTVGGGGNGNATLNSWIADIRDTTTDAPNRGPSWFSSFSESKSFKIERELLIPQLNGDHVIEQIPGLHIDWAANYVKVKQNDDSLAARMWFEPCGFGDATQLACPEGTTRIEIPEVFPVTVNALGVGKYVANDYVILNDNDIHEDQWFGRLDGEYETELTDWYAVSVRSGGWYEHAERDVDSSFLQPGTVLLSNECAATPFCGGEASDPAVFGDSLQELGERLFGFAFATDSIGRLQGTVSTTSKGTRDIQAAALGSRSTFFDQLDVLAGLRIEKTKIESENDPFLSGFEFDGAPQIFPSKWLYFDRFGDNPAREFLNIAPPYNDQVLGITLPSGACRGPNPSNGEAPNPADPPAIPPPATCVDLADRAEIEQLINSEIDENHYLPSVGLAWRPLEGLALRAAYSQTVARPSFREMGYYVTVEPASDDLVVGNPQLQLSDVDSYDLRVEYFFGESGDLAAVSGFYKTIDDPIESIILKNPADFQTDDQFRTFFNNPNQATLWGVELEGRKNLGFVREAGKLGLGRVGADPELLDYEFFDYFSIGANFTWIEAEVDRTEAELLRSAPFYAAGSRVTQNESRRLFGQPEWIVNADVSFDQPDWGTKATLAFYAISDVLDAAGAVTLGGNGQIAALTLDRYVDSFQTLDLIVKQEVWEGLAVKFAAKNLTNSRRQLIYDSAETSDTVEERSLEIGRDFTFELSYTFYELPFFYGD